jgi:hypothetical protein
VQTFIVSYNGIVYQKDLGPDTAKLASAMERYNPDKSWRPTNDEELSATEKNSVESVSP